MEEVTSPAGTFGGFKIESYNQSNGRLLAEYWYSPTVKWLVKIKETLRDGVREEELVSFTVD